MLEPGKLSAKKRYLVPQTSNDMRMCSIYGDVNRQTNVNHLLAKQKESSIPTLSLSPYIVSFLTQFGGTCVHAILCFAFSTDTD